MLQEDRLPAALSLFCRMLTCAVLNPAAHCPAVSGAMGSSPGHVVGCCRHAAAHCVGLCTSQAAAASTSPAPPAGMLLAPRNPSQLTQPFGLRCASRSLHRLQQSAGLQARCAGGREAPQRPRPAAGLLAADAAAALELKWCWSWSCCRRRRYSSRPAAAARAAAVLPARQEAPGWHKAHGVWGLLPALAAL
jgi:hypothetical protein